MNNFGLSFMNISIPSGLFGATMGYAENMSVGELVSALEKYAKAQCPASATGQWAANDALENQSLSSFISSNDFGFASSLLQRHDNEIGRVIDFRIMRKNGIGQTIARFQIAEDIDNIVGFARAIEEVVELAIAHKKLPLIIDFYDALPSDALQLKGKALELIQGEDSISVELSGDLIASYQLSNYGKSIKDIAFLCVRDWSRLADNFGMTVVATEAGHYCTPGCSA